MNRDNKVRVIGKVVSNYDGIVSLNVKKTAECEDCNICFRSDKKIIRVPYAGNLKKDQEVFLTIPCWMILKLSFLFYLLPAIFAMFGFSIGYALRGNLGGFFGAVIFIMLGYRAVKVFVKDRYKNIVVIDKI